MNKRVDKRIAVRGLDSNHGEVREASLNKSNGGLGLRNVMRTLKAGSRRTETIELFQVGMAEALVMGIRAVCKHHTDDHAGMMITSRPTNYEMVVRRFMLRYGRSEAAKDQVRRAQREHGGIPIALRKAITRLETFPESGLSVTDGMLQAVNFANYIESLANPAEARYVHAYEDGVAAVVVYAPIDDTDFDFGIIAILVWSI